MQDIKIYQRIDIEDPTMLAGWPGMGNVALGGIDYIRKKLKATAFAEIDMSQFAAPEGVVVEEGIARLSELPKSVFYYTKNPPLVIFESEAQLGGLASKNLAGKILDLAQELKVRRIYTGAAFPSPISYKDPSEVYGVANNRSLRDFLDERHRVKIMKGGGISGLNGLLLGYAQQRGIEAVCLLATMPQYAINLSNPKASKAIVEALEEILDVRVDIAELDLAIQEMNTRMEAIEEKVREIYPMMMAEEGQEAESEEKIPDYVMERIERLFQEAKVDRKKAYILKEELERWDLFKLYEDRFLDLFRKENQ